MRDLMMVAVMIFTIVLLAAYVAFCDRIVTSADDDTEAPV
jgi:type II secretory pathway component PulJ